MKKCPVCDKTFDDSMRFCQTDGTPLLDFVEEAADDPLKTTVVRQEDFASVIPPQEPFNSSVADAPSKEDSGDLLQLPEEYDPLKTMVAPKESDFGLNLSEPKQETPSSPFESKFEEKPSDFTAPEPPKFNEPSLSPPIFGDMSTPASFEEKKEEEPPPTAIYMPEVNSFPPESSKPLGNSPFDRPMEKLQSDPIPSPFSDTPKQQIPSFQEPVQPSSPFDQPPSPFGGMEQQNQGFNQPVQNADWNPPAAPVSNWQDQSVGANTPFQPPVSGGGGQDQTMAIISLVCALAGFATCISAPVGLVLGYMARKKAQENPQQYGGEGIALAGMIIGGILTLGFVLVIAFYVLIIFGAIASSGF